MFNWPELPPTTPAEDRLQEDYFWATYPADLQKRDDYFREGLALIRTVKDAPEKLRRVVSSYVHFATDHALRAELETFLQSLPPAVPPKDETR